MNKSENTTDPLEIIEQSLRIVIHDVLEKQYGQNWLEEASKNLVKGWIKTLEGGHIVSEGDWIITGIKGETYPCKDDIFKKTYEIIGLK